MVFIDISRSSYLRKIALSDGAIAQTPYLAHVARNLLRMRVASTLARSHPSLDLDFLRF